MIVTVRKLSKMPSIEAFLGSLFLYSKVAIVALLYIADGFLCAVFFSMAFFLQILFPQPDFKGPSAYMYLNELTFNETLRRNKMPVIVEFFATWSPPCTHIAPVFAEISIDYKEVAVFAKVDVGRYPGLAKRFQINTDGTSRQLPTLIKFVRGEEVSRMPTITNSTVDKCLINQSTIVSTFELDQLLEAHKPKNKKEAKKGDKKD
eukprot:TRINITY_DN1291_c0_g1_i3.p1 TRINITY_DN1291_c0_g1~~TRINITY_DN1291_c0_g1_i3.p1  ORF type:complete len:205 (-),score=45.45 TRINITY_DN1291_c0_g1_i3:185-799(-)